MVIVRVPRHDEISLSTALDAGAAAIIVPHCESAEDVRAMMKEIYYRLLPSAQLSVSININHYNSSTRPSILLTLGIHTWSV
jgi:2-keto-3-deoxy-L-rhamnonate aldolase RhmA